MTTIPIEILRGLPGENCEECGCPVCIGFAWTLFAGKKSLEECPYLSQEDIIQLEKISQPPIREINIGIGNATVTIGGEKVLYRHELRFFNPTAVAIGVDDTITREDLEIKLEKISHLIFQRGEKELGIDLITVKSLSNSARSFTNTIKFIRDQTDFPLILYSYDPATIAAGLRIVGDRKPLIGMATLHNWEDMAKMAKECEAPLAIEARLGEMEDLIDKIEDVGLSELVLVPESNGFSASLEDSAYIRYMALKGRGFGYPSISYLKKSLPGAQEICWASAQMLRYAGLIMLNTDEPHFIFPFLTLRQNIFSDPTVAAKVNPGIYTFGSPNENSPVMLTVNFSMTFSTVSSDIRSGNINCYLLVAETGGSAVGISVILKKLTGDSISRLIEETGVRNKVKHNHLIIPGLMRPIKKEIENASQMNVMLGPLESARIPLFIRNEWKGLL